MRLTLFKNIKKIYRQPKIIQWIIAISLSACSAYLVYFVFDVIYLPIVLFLLPLLKPIGHFLVVPLLRLSGVLNYYSPMLIGVWSGEKSLNLHNGSSFDYLVNMRWKQKGQIAKRRMLRYYLKGFLKIIEDIENKKLPREVEVSGTSYFFSERSAMRMGFKLIQPNTIWKFLFFLDYVNLFMMYSYSCGKLRCPKVTKLKKAVITGEKLLQAKEKIITLLNLINRKNNLTTLSAV